MRDSPWRNLREVRSENGGLRFLASWLEHADVLNAEPRVVRILQRHKVTGYVRFVDRHADGGQPHAWQHTFRGGRHSLRRWQISPGDEVWANISDPALKAALTASAPIRVAVKAP